MIIAEDLDTGRVFIMASERGLPASIIKEDGIWKEGAFTADDLNDNFTIVISPERIEELIHEAKATYSTKLSGSNTVSRTF